MTDGSSPTNTQEQHTVVLVLQGAKGCHGVIRNLTARGMMFEGACSLMLGERVAVEIPGRGWAHATVAWSITPRAGISFDAPLPDDILTALRGEMLLTIVRGETPQFGIPQPEQDAPAIIPPEEFRPAPQDLERDIHEGLRAAGFLELIEATAARGRIGLAQAALITS